ncbi:MAG TPA: UPF0175 family protein [Candidatus Nanoarchaeia archaeon]|nr:UPF0175 family protein [Candidatus Nanoarchaeia archaeon]
MAITIIIPDDIEQALKIPASEQEWEIDKELALSLYERGALSLGKARQLARISKWQFQKELQKKKIFRHYTKKELQEDVLYGRSE